MVEKPHFEGKFLGGTHVADFSGRVELRLARVATVRQNSKVRNSGQNIVLLVIFFFIMANFGALNSFMRSDTGFMPYMKLNYRSRWGRKLWPLENFGRAYLVEY